MSPGQVSRQVVVERLGGIASMLVSIRALPLGEREVFFADERNVWTAESCLRRALEGLLDIGRHILAKGFATAVADYKAIARELGRADVLLSDEAELLATLAGYRNRMVHFYHDVTPGELYTICSEQLGDVERITAAYARWLRENPERVDGTL